MKKKYILTLAALFSVTILSNCKNGSGSSAEANFDKEASYALGMSIGTEMGNNIEMSGIVPDFDELVKGFKDAITGKKTRFDPYEANEIVEAAFYKLMESQNTDSIERETAFLVENSKKPGIIITPSGLQYEILTETTGPKPTANDMVKVDYEGKLTDGSVFDSSYQNGQPVTFPLNGVIQGWTEGLQLMSVGSKYIFYIPYDLGYGPGGYGRIPAYATLIFTVELLEILN